jgi:HEAT repeat protein
VRADALKALGQISDPSSVEPVKATLKDTESYVRLVAINTLADLNPAELAACVRSMLADKNLRAAAGRVLSESPECDSKPTKGALKINRHPI